MWQKLFTYLFLADMAKNAILVIIRFLVYQAVSISYFNFSVALRPSAGNNHLEVSRSHTTQHQSR